MAPPTKKRKVGREPSQYQDDLKRLENRLTAAVNENSSLNPLADLLDLAHSAEDAQNLSKALYALYRVFILIIRARKLDVEASDESRVVRDWIREKLTAYTDLLGHSLQDDEQTIRASSLQIMFSLLKDLSSSLSKQQTNHEGRPQFHIPHFKKIVYYLLVCPPSRREKATISGIGILKPDIRDLFVDTWLSVHDDVRWFFLRESVSVLSNHPPSKHPNVVANLVMIFEKLTTFPTDPSELNSWWVEEFGTKPPKGKHATKDAGLSDEEEPTDEDDWRKFFDETQESEKQKSPSLRLHKMTIHQSLHSLASHRAVFTRSWLTLLPQLSVSTDPSAVLSIRALNVMHRGVLPHLTRAVLVMDWISSCVDLGGVVGLLALNALFVLMKEYNLDYPSFYTRLYAFLDRDVLHLKYRARFFRMTELFLSSSHLPATLLASFVKRFSRLSLNAPPAAIIMVIPFTYNILKRHPALMVMIHRDGDGVDSDPFIPDEKNPNITNALESSLWELYSQKHHYHPAVSTLARILEEAFTKPGYSMEDFLDHTYGTLLDAEFKRKIKKEPALAMNLPKDAFAVVNEASSVGNDHVGDMWSFGGIPAS